MKTLLALIAISVSGCVSIEYGDVKYSRIGYLATKGVVAEIVEPNGVILKIKIESSESEKMGDWLVPAIQSAFEAGLKAGKAAALP